MTGSEDLHVVVQEPEQFPAKPPPTNPSRLPSWLQSNRNKTIAGLGLLCVLLPVIIAPAVVVSQKQSAQRLSNSSGSRAANQDGSTVDPNTFVDVNGDLNSNATIKVPTRTLNKTLDRNLTFEPETPKRFVAIKDGQVSTCYVLVCGLGVAQLLWMLHSADDIRDAVTYGATTWL